MWKLRLSVWHLVVWLTMATVHMGLVYKACLGYNEIAGTDKTPGHIALICLAALAGPWCGPVANWSGGVDVPSMAGLSAMLIGFQLLSLLPFVLVNRPVPLIAVIAAWTLFVFASGLWFFAGGLSLGFFLS